MLTSLCPGPRRYSLRAGCGRIAARLGDCALHALGGDLDRLDDVLVASTAAEVAGQRLADLGLGRGRVLAQEGQGGDQEARRAEAALQAVGFPVGVLDRVQL